MAASSALEPAIDIAQQNAAGVGDGGPQVARPPGAGAHSSGAGERALAIGGHNRLAGRASGRRVAVPLRVLVEEPGAAAQV
jgi:hypothetical protein